MVDGKKITAWNTVTVSEYNVFVGSLEYGFVQNATLAETVILLPNMFDLQTQLISKSLCVCSAKPQNTFCSHSVEL